MSGHDVRFYGRIRDYGPAGGEIVVRCEPCVWSVQLEGGHDIADLTRLVTMHTGAPVPPGLGGFDLTIRQALRDATRWQHATRASDDPDGQIGIYLSAARYFGLDLGRGLTAAEAPDLMARQAQIRLVLDLVLGDELADRQYALEQIDGILRGER
jgi:hypothetical protein